MTNILIVDDEPINRMIVENTLSDSGYQLDQAEDGEEAWDKLQQQHYDLIVLDRMMPRLDGLSLLRRMRADARFEAIPVILQTAASSQLEIKEGIEAGAYHYLTKPYDPSALTALVNSTIAELNEKLELRNTNISLTDTLTLFDHGKLYFRTLKDARSIASALSNLCTDHQDVTSIGLLELLLNAIEHGNLGITYQEKTNLRINGGWEAEIERRLNLSPWKDNYGTLTFQRTGDELSFTITDHGNGFEWQKYMDFDPERAFDPNGRGIAMARMIGFASVEYQGCGNTVVARVH